MKDILIKARRAVRFLFYRDVSIEDQILVSDTLDDAELEILFWKLNKADRHHSIDCLLYTSPSPRDPIGSRMPSSA